MEVQYQDSVRKISDRDSVTLTVAGNVREIMFQSSKPKGSAIRVLDKDMYIYLPTGEVCFFTHNNLRMQAPKEVRRTMRRAAFIINANTADTSRCRWLTLTYADNMQDYKKLRRDFDNFKERLQARCGHFEYIVCAEPQARGAWHLHVILVFPGKAPFLSNDLVSDCWKKGFVHVRALDDNDNVGLDLTSYLADIPLEDLILDKDYRDEKGRLLRPEGFELGGVLCEKEIGSGKHLKKKRIAKGVRLYMYPAGMRIFRYSRGVVRPEVKEMPYAEAKKEVEGLVCTYVSDVVLSDGDDFQKEIVKEHYNIKRKKK